MGLLEEPRAGGGGVPKKETLTWAIEGIRGYVPQENTGLSPFTKQKSAFGKYKWNVQLITYITKINIYRYQKYNHFFFELL